jgi:hypothetical protein
MSFPPNLDSGHCVGEGLLLDQGRYVTESFDPHEPREDERAAHGRAAHGRQ